MASVELVPVLCENSQNSGTMKLASSAASTVTLLPWRPPMISMMASAESASVGEPTFSSTQSAPTSAEKLHSAWPAAAEMNLVSTPSTWMRWAQSGSSSAVDLYWTMR